jgi:hypothetical protein
MYRDIVKCKTSLYQYTILSNALFFTILKAKTSHTLLYLFSIYYLVGNYEIFNKTSEVILKNHIKIKENKFKWLYIYMLPCILSHVTYYHIRYFSKMIMQEISMNLVNKITIKYPENFSFPSKYGLCMNHSKDPYSLDHALLFYGIPTSHTPYILERKNPKSTMTKIRNICRFYESIIVVKDDKEYNKKSLEQGKTRFQLDPNPSAFVFFPEGTTKKNEIIPFREGGFRFCVDTMCPIVLMCIILTSEYEVILDIVGILTDSNTDQLKLNSETKLTNCFKNYQKKYNVIN